MTTPNTNAERPTPEPFKTNETMYLVYARLIGCDGWYPQESSESKEDVLYWAQRANSRNAKEYEPGAGREFVAVERVSLFRRISDEVSAVDIVSEVAQLRRERDEAREALPIVRQIVAIMDTYHEQDARPEGIGTPGGLEHMGDVWRLLMKWEPMARAAISAARKEQA